MDCIFSALQSYGKLLGVNLLKYKLDEKLSSQSTGNFPVIKGLKYLSCFFRLGIFSAKKICHVDLNSET